MTEGAKRPAYRSFERRGAKVEGGVPDATLGNLGELVTTREAIEATKLSRRTILHAIRTKELPAFVPGGRDPRRSGRGVGYRIWKRDLEAWFFGAARGAIEKGGES